MRDYVCGYDGFLKLVGLVMAIGFGVFVGSGLVALWRTL